MDPTLRLLLGSAVVWTASAAWWFVVLVIAAVAAGPTGSGGEAGVAVVLAVSALVHIVGAFAVWGLTWISEAVGPLRWLIAAAYSGAAGMSWLMAGLMTLVAFNR